MSEEIQILKRIDKKIEQLLKWARFAGMLQLRNILSQNLIDDKASLIYEFSNGERSTRDIAKLVNVSHGTISNYWKKWVKLGIVEPSLKFQGRFQKICSLEEVGLTVPPIPRGTITIGVEEESTGEELIG